MSNFLRKDSPWWARTIKDLLMLPFEIIGNLWYNFRENFILIFLVVGIISLLFSIYYNFVIVDEREQEYIRKHEATAKVYYLGNVSKVNINSHYIEVKGWGKISGIGFLKSGFKQNGRVEYKVYGDGSVTRLCIEGMGCYDEELYVSEGHQYVKKELCDVKK